MVKLFILAKTNRAPYEQHFANKNWSSILWNEINVYLSHLFLDWLSKIGTLDSLMHWNWMKIGRNSVFSADFKFRNRFDNETDYRYFDIVASWSCKENSFFNIKFSYFFLLHIRHFNTVKKTNSKNEPRLSQVR